MEEWPKPCPPNPPLSVETGEFRPSHLGAHDPSHGGSLTPEAWSRPFAQERSEGMADSMPHSVEMKPKQMKHRCKGGAAAATAKPNPWRHGTGHLSTKESQEDGQPHASA